MIGENPKNFAIISQPIRGEKALLPAGTSVQDIFLKNPSEN